ncbi:ATP-binding protein [Achromobacter spanius]|uniref:ATP-binding protein n=1 Tax=Achromobacter spanius TaxID=217203 RepID=A0AA42S6J0_9BURK|nr:ATP-binding protein [Achromobacter spanius]MDH0738701.1 ATP-binding protein [Achromobacter spanius]
MLSNELRRLLFQGESGQKHDAEPLPCLSGDEVLAKAHVPTRYKSCTFDTFHAYSEEHKARKLACESYSKHFNVARYDGVSMVLGGPQKGKTHLATAMLFAVIASGSTGRLIRARRAIADVVEYGEDALAELANPDLLVLDGLLSHPWDEAGRHAIFELIERRFEEVKPTVITTHLRKATFLRAVGDRIASRLRENGGKFVSFE